MKYIILGGFVLIIVFLGYNYIYKANCECTIDLTCVKNNINDHGECLSNCDKIMDVCYSNCIKLKNKEDQNECIKQCYSTKSVCYIECMGDSINKDSSNGGCKQCSC